MSDETLSYELSQLSRKSLTTLTLSGLDFVVPGGYQNINSLEDMVGLVTGDVRVGRLQAIANHVDQLYAESSGARRAVWLYKLTDSTDKAVAAAALANKVGSKIEMLSFLSKLTPKADTSQTLDLCLKLTAEALAYLSLHGMSSEGIDDWAKSFGDEKGFGNEAALRMAAIIGVDGLIPLGADFLKKAEESLSGGELPWSDNPLFKKMAEYIPGADLASKSGFVGQLVGKVSSPLSAFIEKTGLSRDKVVGGLQKVTDFSDSKLDYVAAFFDASTNFVSHTGVQSVARHLVRQSAGRFGYEL